MLLQMYGFYSISYTLYLFNPSPNMWSSLIHSLLVNMTSFLKKPPIFYFAKIKKKKKLQSYRRTILILFSQSHLFKFLFPSEFTLCKSTLICMCINKSYSSVFRAVRYHSDNPFRQNKRGCFWGVISEKFKLKESAWDYLGRTNI